MDHAEKLARKFHDTYERLAPNFGYETRDDTKAFDPTTPNGKLMIAVCGELGADVHHGKETSARISHIAGVVMNATADGAETPEDFARLLADAKRLAGSCMSQDETPGQEKPKGDFHSRLKDEREDLDRRLTALNSYLTHNPGHPNPRHNAMLTEQARLMSELLAILDERLCDIAISERSAPVLAVDNEDDGA
jgi:uncharacterized protein YjiS (DUF1127 family)